MPIASPTFSIDDARLAAAGSRTQIFSAEYAADLQEPLIGALFAIGLYLAVTRLQLEVHDLLILSILMIRTFGALLPMQRLAQRFIQSYDQYVSLCRLLETTEEAKEVAGGQRVPSLRQSIRFDRVAFSYDKRPILQGLDLEIAKGKITALVGPSGVGKSTLVDLLVGLYQPTAGAVRADGVDLREIDLAAWRHGLGYVPQEVLLFHDTVRNNVTLFEDDVPEVAVIQALQAAGAWGFVNELPQRLETIVGERGNRLSGGQRQRISIARAMLHRPRLLILDEATTGLDQETELAICSPCPRVVRADRADGAGGLAPGRLAAGRARDLPDRQAERVAPAASRGEAGARQPGLGLSAAAMPAEELEPRARAGARARHGGAAVAVSCRQAAAPGRRLSGTSRAR